MTPPLTDPQRATLKANILATPAANALYQAGNLSGLADFYNQPVAPQVWAWRSLVPITEIMSNGFAWDRVDNLTVGRARIWEYMTALGAINGSAANVRAGINAAFNQAADSAMRLAIFGHCQRAATRLESLFVLSGSGTTTTDQGVGPVTLAVEGPIDYTDFIEL